MRNFLPNRLSITGLLCAPGFAKARHDIHKQTPEHEQRQAVRLTCGVPYLGIPLACTGENFLHNAWVYRRKPARQPMRRGRCGEEFAC